MVEKLLQRINDGEEYWIEVLRDDDIGILRAPTGVIEQMLRWATKWGYIPRQHLKQEKQEDGKVVRISGTCAEMMKFVKAAQDGAPGRLTRLFEAIDKEASP